MLNTTLAPRTGTLPRITWRWEAETDILSGTTRMPVAGEPAAAVEVSSPDGAVIVLDVIGGELCGLDIVIWPDVETVPVLDAPVHPEAGRVMVPAGSAARQEEEELAIQVDGPERTFHLRVGPARDTRTVQVADHLLVEVDADGALAGFWLTGVPPFPSEE